MGRIADAIFNGAVSGAARGMTNYLQEASDSEKRAREIAKERFEISPSERIPVKTFPDGQDRYVVGERKRGTSSVISRPTLVKETVSSENPLKEDIPNSKNEDLKEPSSSSTATISPPTLAKEVVSSDNPLKENTPVPKDENPKESPKDSFPQPQSDLSQKSTERSFDSSAISQPFNAQRASPSYTYDQVKHGIKTTLIDARKMAKLDGLYGRDKKSLNEIVTFTANRITSPEGLTKSERKKYNYVADLTLKKLEDYIKEIAPQVDAKAAAKTIILRSSNAEKSAVCVDKAAQAAMNLIRSLPKPQESSVLGPSSGYPLNTTPVNTPSIPQKRHFEHLNSDSKLIQSKANSSSVHQPNPKAEYLLGLAQILGGGALMFFGGAIEFGSGGLLTFGFLAAESTGLALITQGLSHTTRSAQNISFDTQRNRASPLPSDMQKKGSFNPTFPANPDDLSKRPGWKEITHPDAGSKGHRRFENEYTGEQYLYDKGRPNKSGHEAKDHWHHLRPNGKGGYEYLDGNGNPVPRGHDKSHIYTGK